MLRIIIMIVIIIIVIVIITVRVIVLTIIMVHMFPGRGPGVCLNHLVYNFCCV